MEHGIEGLRFAHVVVFFALEKLLEKRFFFGVADDVHAFAGGNIGELLGDFEGAIEAAELVHQAELFRLRAGPDAAFADFVHGFDRHFAALGDASGEIGVGVVERFLNIGALRGGEILLRGEHRGVVAGGHGIRAHAETRVESRDVEFADQHADGASDGAGVRHDFTSRGCDPVAAGGRDVRHGNDDGLDLIGQLDFAANYLAADYRTAAGIHAQHDGFDTAIGASGANIGCHGIAAHHRTSAGRAAGISGNDQAGGVDYGNSAAAVIRDGGAIAIQRDGIPPAVVILEITLQLIPVAEAVHDFVGDRVTGRKRAAVQQRFKLRAIHAAGFGGVVQILIVDAVQQAFDLFLVRGRKLFLGESVAGGFEFGDVIELGDDFQLVEGAAEEKRLGHHAANADGRGGHQPDLLAGAGEIIFGVADSVVTEIADAGFAAFAKGEQVAANFLELAPASFQRGDAHHESGDVRIFGGGVNGVHVIVQHWNGVAAEGAEKIGGALFFDLAGGVNHQDRVGRQTQAAAGFHRYEK